MDNTTLNPGTGGDTIREVDKAGAKAQVVILDIGGAGAESLLTGALPVSVASLPLPTTAGSLVGADTGTVIGALAAGVVQGSLSSGMW